MNAFFFQDVPSTKVCREILNGKTCERAVGGNNYCQRSHACLQCLFSAPYLLQCDHTVYQEGGITVAKGKRDFIYDDTKESTVLESSSSQPHQLMDESLDGSKKRSGDTSICNVPKRQKPSTDNSCQVLKKVRSFEVPFAILFLNLRLFSFYVFGNINLFGHKTNKQN